MSIEYKRTGFQAAVISTDYMNAGAEISITDSGSGSVHIKIEPTNFWSAGDLRELAGHLNDIAGELE